MVCTLRNILSKRVMGSLDPSLMRKVGPWSREGRIRRLLIKKKRRKKGKPSKKVLCKDKVSSLICRAPSLRTGKKTSSFKIPNFVVPSSIVQDPGIKGVLFQVDCHQLFVARNAGLCASPSRCTDSAEVFSKGPVENGFFEHLEDGAGSSLCLRRHRKCDLGDVRAGSSAADGGRVKGVCAGSCGSAGGVGGDDCAGSSSIAGGGCNDAHVRFSGVASRVGADSCAGPSATAGESSGIIGLSDSSLHLSRDSNSLNSSVSRHVCMCECCVCLACYCYSTFLVCCCTLVWC